MGKFSKKNCEYKGKLNVPEFDHFKEFLTLESEYKIILVKR